MLYKSKLRGSFGRIYPISLLIVYILCLFEILIRWYLNQEGASILIVPAVSISIGGLFFISAGILQWMNYGMLIYVWLGFHLGLGCIFSIFLFPNTEIPMVILYLANLLMVILIIVLNWQALASQERFEANARRIFRLAASQINSTSDGFTSRPYSAGTVEVEGDDLQGLGQLLQSGNIARILERESALYFVFSMNKSVLLFENPEEGSFVAIDPNGNVSVQIVEADYKRYRDKYRFDLLCDALAGLFIRFLNHYQHGHEQKIFSELKRTGRGLF